jgi:hypothetical protein
MQAYLVSVRYRSITVTLDECKTFFYKIPFAAQPFQYFQQNSLYVILYKFQMIKRCLAKRIHENISFKPFY